jgi:hypothetical protein
MIIHFYKPRTYYVRLRESKKLWQDNYCKDQSGKNGNSPMTRSTAAGLPRLACRRILRINDDSQSGTGAGQNDRSKKKKKAFRLFRNLQAIIFILVPEDGIEPS